jgi:hypothetical protein
MNHVQSTLEAIRAFLDDDFPNYSETLGRAFSEVDPVFVRPRYADFFWHCSTTVLGWLPRVVLASATAESEGSLRLLSLWKAVDYYKEAEDWVLTHSKDESRHSRLFVRLVDLAFPKFFRPEDLLQVKESLSVIGPADLEKFDFKLSEDSFMDHLMQVNMGEIRTRIHMQMLAPVFYNVTPKEFQPQVGRMLERLEQDEIRHIAYTVNILETWARNGEAKRMTELYAERLRNFHIRTISETENAVHDYGQGQFPELLEI